MIVKRLSTNYIKVCHDDFMFQKSRMYHFCTSLNKNYIQISNIKNDPHNYYLGLTVLVVLKYKHRSNYVCYKASDGK